jgi:hypothetical protein
VREHIPVILRTCLITIVAAIALLGCQERGVDWNELQVDSVSPNVVLWNGSAWESLGEGFDDLVSEVAFGPDGVLYAGGHFTHSGLTSCKHVARWDKDARAWKSLGDGVNGTVRAFAFDGANVLVAGNFTAAYNTDGSTVDVEHLAAWDGTRWSPVASGITEPIYDLLFVRGDLYAGTERSLFRVNLGTSYAEGLADFDNGANTLALYGDTLFIGGWFDRFGDILPSGVTILNLSDSSWRQTTYLATNAPRQNDYVTDMAVGDSMLYLAGGFFVDEKRSVAAIDLRTGNHLPIVGLDGPAYAIDVSGDYLYAGGEFFETQTGQSLIGAGRYNMNSRTWEPVGKGVKGVANDIAVNGTAVVYAGQIEGVIR